MQHFPRGSLGELQEFLFYLPPYLPLGLMVAHRLPVTGRLFQERYDALPEASKVGLLHLERWHNLEGNTLTFIEIIGAKGQCQQGSDSQPQSATDQPGP